MATIRLEKELGPAKRAVLKGLRVYNEKHLGKIDHKSLSITLREKKDIVGGIIGDTHLGWLFVQYFWIDEKFRGKGFGKRLLGMAEDEARKRGMKNVYLDTFSFQAQPFYEKLGYREFGRLNNYPSGHARIWLSKAL